MSRYCSLGTGRQHIYGPQYSSTSDTCSKRSGASPQRADGWLVAGACWPASYELRELRSAHATMSRAQRQGVPSDVHISSSESAAVRCGPM